MCTSGQYDRGPDESRELFDVPDPVELIRIWSVNSVGLETTERPGSDFETALRVGLGLALVLLDDSDPSGRRVLARLEVSAARWARDGVPLETVQHALHEGVKNGLGLRDRIAGTASADGCFVVDVLDTLTAAVSRVYAAQVRSGQERA